MKELYRVVSKGGNREFKVIVTNKSQKEKLFSAVAATKGKMIEFKVYGPIVSQLKDVEEIESQLDLLP